MLLGTEWLPGWHGDGPPGRRLAPCHPRRRADCRGADRCDAHFAETWWHWFFFAQPGKPERAILADPDVWYAGSPQQMGSEAYADFRAAIHDPATVHGMLEDYRGRLGIDRQHYEDDRRHGRRIRCPTLVLRSLRDDLERLYGDVMEVWKPGRQAGAEGVSIAATTWPRKRRTN